MAVNGTKQGKVARPGIGAGRWRGRSLCREDDEVIRLKSGPVPVCSPDMGLSDLLGCGDSQNVGKKFKFK